MNYAAANPITILCVDAVENDIAKGRFYHGDFSREYAFSGFADFALAVDDLLRGDGRDIPGVEHRGPIHYAGRVATFKLCVRFRQNESWQGSVMWLETRHEEHFRSELELMSVIHQALVPAQKQRMCPSSLKIAK